MPFSNVFSKKLTRFFAYETLFCQCLREGYSMKSCFEAMLLVIAHMMVSRGICDSSQ